MEHKVERKQTAAGHSLFTPFGLRALQDDILLARLEALVCQERESTVDVIEHLMEVHRRELAIDLSYPSLFLYCVKKLNYSEAAAFARIRAARAAMAFPEILQRLRNGTLHIEAVVRLYPYLDEDNNQELLERASGATKREVLGLVAQLQSEPGPSRDVIVPVASDSVSASLASESGAGREPDIIPPPSHRFHFTADAELVAMVQRLRELMRHKVPDGRLERIFKEAARVLIERIERERNPRPIHLGAGNPSPEPRSDSRTIPRSIKRLVWTRDGARCSYTATDGRRCESREALEYDHIVPWADGGRSDAADNIRLLCRAHNQRLGRRRFGPRKRAGS